jgi:L-malate glycosyltransferase
MEKIRVLHCLESIGLGGVEQLRYSISKYLDKDHFEQKIICTREFGVLPAKMRAQGMEVIPIGGFDSPFHFARYRRVIQEIRKFKPHIIHGAVFEGVTMGVVAGKIARVPAIVIEETSDPVDRSWRGNLLMRLFCWMSDRVVAEAAAGEEYLRSKIKIKEPKLQLIINGVDFPVYPTEESSRLLKDQLGIKPGDFVVGSIGRLLDAHKRFSDLIKAIALLKERNVLVKLLIVGDGPDMDMLRSLSVSLGIEEDILFVGYQGNTAPYYACMDIFSLASQTEAFGLVLVDAMLFRLPVVATSVGGIKYVVADGQTGILVPKNSPAPLAAAIETFFYDEGKRRLFGEAGYVRAMEKFTAPVYVKNIEKLYRDVLRSKGVLT